MDSKGFGSHESGVVVVVCMDRIRTHTVYETLKEVGGGRGRRHLTLSDQRKWETCSVDVHRLLTERFLRPQDSGLWTLKQGMNHFP